MKYERLQLKEKKRNEIKKKIKRDGKLRRLCA